MQAGPGATRPVDEPDVACPFMHNQTLTEQLFGTAETHRMVRENFAPQAQFVRAVRLYNLHPVTLYTYVLPLTMLFTGLIKPEYPDLDAPELVGHLLTAFKVLVYWAFSWAFLGHLAWWLMHRGVPFVMVPIGLWVLAVLVSQGASLLFIPDFDWKGMRILRQASLTLPSTLVAVYAAAPVLRDRLGVMPELVPIWTFNLQVRVPLLLKLPANRRGRLRRIHAANQYVEVVTEQGTTLLRMSLRDAVALVPAEKGWLCHRSLWIRRDEVVSLGYVRGQPQITDSEGQFWPVSRASVPEIRAWLQKHRPLVDDPPVPEPVATE